MGDECVSAAASDPFLVKSGPDSKVLVEKRGASRFEERSAGPCKRAKMRDHESALPAEGVDTHCPNLHGNEGGLVSGEKEISQVTEEPKTMSSGAVQVDRTGGETVSLQVDHRSGPLHLNSEAYTANISTRVDPPASRVDFKKPFSLGKHKMAPDSSIAASRNIGLDLNAEDASSMVNQNPFFPYKNLDNLKSVDASECGSTTGPLEPEEKDPFQVWKEMKQNGFLSSSSHGGIPVPKQRARKSKSDIFKKKMELAKREQVDRFTKIAAPSGLLNELNPGIINHVRNSKQVHSIIEAMVRSEKDEHARAESSRSQSRSKDTNGRNKDAEYVNDSGRSSFSHSHEVGPPNFLLGNKQTKGCHVPSKKSHFSSVGKHGDSSMVENWGNSKHSCTSHCNHEMQDDTLALKLSSSTDMVSETTSSLSNKEPPSISTIPSLSVKAATVASQWLELLYQDIKGRLAALRRSKKRVRSAIHTELPFLMSKEFSSARENDPSFMNISAANSSCRSIAEMHHARWGALFDQMDKALCEEEKQLESWFNQVKEMQLHCEWGLQRVPWNAPCTLQELGILMKDFRSENEDNSEKDLAVQAAAASIYSTCNFLSSKENISCS